MQQHVARGVAYQHGNGAMFQAAAMHLVLGRDALRDIVRIDEHERLIGRSRRERVQLCCSLDASAIALSLALDT